MEPRLEIGYTSRFVSLAYRIWNSALILLIKTTHNRNVGTTVIRVWVTHAIIPQTLGEVIIVILVREEILGCNFHKL